MGREQIEADRYYSVRQVAAMKVLPWRSAMTLAVILKEEKWRNIFQPMVDKKKSSVRMHVKGENIIKFLEMADKGELSK